MILPGIYPIAAFEINAPRYSSKISAIDPALPADGVAVAGVSSFRNGDADAVQATAADKPIFDVTSIAQFPAFRFNGTNHLELDASAVDFFIQFDANQLAAGDVILARDTDAVTDSPSWQLVVIEE